MEWLLFLSQLPATPSSLRVMVWRRMKAAGAVGLQNGVWVLPLTDEHRKFLEDLLDTIRGQQAGGQIFVTRAAGEVVEQDLLRRFQADREQEYGEFLEQCRGFLDEIEKETGRGKFTFAELEENEQNLQRLSNWLSKIQARDFFPSPQRDAAAAGLEACRQALQAYSSRVFEQEALDSAADGSR